MAVRAIGPNKRTTCNMFFSGVSDSGSSDGETRTLVEVVCANENRFPVRLTIEEEANKANRFTTVFQIGGPTTVATPALVQRWNAQKGVWDGLNVYWECPTRVND